MTSLGSLIAHPGKIALIVGVGGQDGAYLAKLLLEKGYSVVGTSRDAGSAKWSGLQTLGIASKVQCITMVPQDFRSVVQTVARHDPVEIYNLAGQTSVGLSFEQPVEAIESIAIGTLNLLEAIRFVGKPIRFYNAGSSECFGDTGSNAASETTPFRPRSPYAVAKVCSHNLVSNYRDAYGMYASTGILFNHESPLRPERFVTQKIVANAWRIANNAATDMSIGNLDIHRDWGWAPDYVDAMWRMLQLDEPRDLVIATGRTVSLEHFVKHAFDHFRLDWHKYVKQDKTLLRPSDIKYGVADPSLACELLGWKANYDVDRVITEMCNAYAQMMTDR